MRILFIGDIVGSPGRHIIEEKLRLFQDENNIDFTIANGENSAGGFGINKKVFTTLVEMGVDCFTMGNHLWDNKDIFNFIEGEKRIVRPANLNPALPGQAWHIYQVGDEMLAVTNVVGRIYMPPAECPFLALDAIIKEVHNITPNILVDIHAEATSEKVALGWYLDGRVSAVIGTHTHIQTNDSRILPRGTAYLTDAGMTGPRDSVLGVDRDIIINKFLTQVPAHFEVAKGDIQFNGVIIEINQDGRAQTIEAVNFYEPSL